MYVQRVSVNPSKLFYSFLFNYISLQSDLSYIFSPLQPKYAHCQFHQFLQTGGTLTKSTQIILSFAFNIPCTKRVSQVQYIHKLERKWRQLQLKIIYLTWHIPSTRGKAFLMQLYTWESFSWKSPSHMPHSSRLRMIGI